MPVDTVHFYILVAVVSLVMAALFPVFKSIRDRHRREQAGHLRK